VRPQALASADTGRRRAQEAVARARAECEAVVRVETMTTCVLLIARTQRNEPDKDDEAERARVDGEIASLVSVARYVLHVTSLRFVSVFVCVRAQLAKRVKSASELAASLKPYYAAFRTAATNELRRVVRWAESGWCVTRLMMCVSMSGVAGSIPGAADVVHGVAPGSSVHTDLSCVCV
jgi:hypothetical protein